MTNSGDARAPEVSSYASVNGLEMYYEIHGSGEPLVLLHGAFSAIGRRSESFCRILPRLGGIAFDCRRTDARDMTARSPWSRGWPMMSPAPRGSSGR